MSNIAVIGGGASGITAAVTAAKNPANSVTIYEHCDRIGRKILATGNGRCNLTNINADALSYHGEDTGFMTNVINEFWVDKTVKWFESMGVLCKIEDGGKVYPYSGQASSVLDVLRYELKRCSVNIRTGFEAAHIKRKNGGFLIRSYSGENAYADKVIVAAGGKAAPSLGSNGSGYALLKELGHTVTDVRPSLVQIKSSSDVPKKLKGIKLNAAVTLGEYSDCGEVLFTEYGFSGPPIFNLTSRLDKQRTLCLDIMPEYGADTVKSMLRKRRENLFDVPLEGFFSGLLNKRVGQILLKYVGIAPLSRPGGDLSDDEVQGIAEMIKNWEFEISGTMSWNNAQVTKGGAKTREFNPKTLESRLCPGIYVAGEILDIDGDCGGFNLQWAWSSGYIAGKNAGEVEF